MDLVLNLVLIKSINFSINIVHILVYTITKY